MIRILLYSSLFPNSVQQRHGIFVEQRMRQLITSGEVEVRVVAPVPWFPFTNPRFGRYARMATIPAHEGRDGIQVIHPRYPVLPKIGTSLHPFLMAIWTFLAVKRIKNQGYNFELIDAHFIYPDGVAAMWIGRMLKIPVVLTGRGTDIRGFPRYRVPRVLVRWAGKHAAGIITVCEELRQRLGELGVDKSKVLALRNGVDLSRFQPQDREQCRRELIVEGTVLVSVGNLIELKGQDLTIRALAELPNVTLLLVGDGPKEAEYRQLVESLGLQNRVRFTGPVPQAELSKYYSAADIMVLASSREGMANVLLESLACGTPVVATAVSGTPEVIASEEAGVLVHERTPEGIREGIKTLLANYPDREKTRQYATGFTWDATTQGQLRLFKEILANHSPA